MTLYRCNVALAVLLAVVLLAAWSIRIDPQTPNWDFLPDMQYSPAYGALSANPNFAEGRTWQPSPDGTIARGETRLDYVATPEDAVRAGEELTSPIAMDDATAIPRGATVYRVNCAMCHGPQGHGDGPATKRGMPPPPSLLSGKSREMKDGQLMHILTYGQGSMAPFAAQLSLDERWAVIAYVRDMQAKAAADAAAADATADAAAADATADAAAVAKPGAAP